MKQLTIRGVDLELELKLREVAHQRGQSMNRTVIGLLREATAPSRWGQKIPANHDLDHLAGSWSKEKADAFRKVLAEIRQVEPDMWK